MPSIKKTKRVLGAKVEVTKSDAKKVSPLTRFWGGRIHDARIQGMVIGGSVVLIADLLVRALSV